MNKRGKIKRFDQRYDYSQNNCSYKIQEYIYICCLINAKRSITFIQIAQKRI